MKIELHPMRAVDLRPREARVDPYPRRVRVLIWSLCALALAAFWAGLAMGIMALLD